jgi:hypothetical protein
MTAQLRTYMADPGVMSIGTSLEKCVSEPDKHFSFRACKAF